MTVDCISAKFFHYHIIIAFNYGFNQVQFQITQEQKLRIFKFWVDIDVKDYLASG